MIEERKDTLFGKISGSIGNVTEMMDEIAKDLPDSKEKDELVKQAGKLRAHSVGFGGEQT